jgi:putative ABC transport system permease protein
MNWSRKITSRLRALFRRSTLEADMAEELRAHLEMQEAANRAAGMAPEEAHFAARRQFGHLDGVKETVRDQRSWMWLESLAKDLRFAVRSLRKTPGFTAIALLTLAVATGVNSSIFKIVHDLVLRPLIQEKQSRLVSIFTAREGANRTFRSFTYAEFTALRESPEVFSDVAATQFAFCALGSRDQFQRSYTYFVSDNYFSVLGAQPLAGRFFTAEEARPNANLPVTVASYTLWQRLGGRPDFVGSQMQINDRQCLVVGIAPPGFCGVTATIGPEIWLPLGMASQLSPTRNLLDRQAAVLDLTGRLQAGLALESAHVRLAALDRQLNASAPFPDDGARQLVLTPPQRFNLSTSPENEGPLRPASALIMGMAAIVLFIASLNLANMFLARGVTRRKEIAIRLSLGATRQRVVRQLLVEGLVLALAGGLIGLLLSVWCDDLLIRFLHRLFSSTFLSFHAQPNRDWLDFAVAFAFCFATTLIFSLGPALRSTRLDLVRDLKAQSGDPLAAGRWNRFFSVRHSLVMAQIALSLMLLFTAGLFLRGALKASRAEPGFQLTGELVANIDYSLARTPASEISPRQQALLARASALPGVERAALASLAPYYTSSATRLVFPLGSGSSDPKAREAYYIAVTHDYFATLGIPLLRGRDFSKAESTQSDGPRVAIIDDRMARSLFGGEDVLGRHIALSENDARGQNPARELEIIAIVRSPRQNAGNSGNEVAPFRLYRPFGQVKEANTFLHVKVAQPAAVSLMLDTLRRELRALDPANPVLLLQPMSELVNGNLTIWFIRLLAAIFGVFGGVALLLAVVGVYGVKAYAVERRTQEIGIRMALGARPAQVLGLILRQGVLQTALAVTAGVGLALGAGRLLAPMAYEANPSDPFALGSAVLLLAATALLACWLPARRATRVNPVEALRAE